MKFLVYNYSTPWNTQPLYFNTCLNTLSGTQSVMFDNSLSVFDNFDKVEPDIFITSIENLHKDLISYIENNQTKLLKLAINVDKGNIESVSKLNSLLETLPIKFLLFGTSKYDNIKNYIHLLNAADVSLSDMKMHQNFEIDELIFINSKEEIREKNYTYHYTSTNANLKQDVDFILDIRDLKKVLKNYKKIVFANPEYIGTQIMFESIYSGVKTVFDTTNDVTENINDIFKGEKMFSSVKKHHTSLHRLKKILSYFTHSTYTDQIDSLIKRLIT